MIVSKNLAKLYYDEAVLKLVKWWVRWFGLCNFMIGCKYGAIILQSNFNNNFF